MKPARHLLPLAITLQAASAAAADGLEEEIVVTGRAQEFYLESETRVGTKVATDIMDIPQSVQVLSAQLMRDQAARQVTDLYRAVAGVSEFSYSGVTFRGFRDDANVFYDGVRGDPYSGFGVPQLFNFERVEILKGPAGALYGGGEPGGMINYVSKKPRFEEATEVNLTLGNYERLGGSVDTTGSLGESVAYRFGTFYEEQDSFRNNADAINQEVAGGLLFQLAEKTRLTTTLDYINQDLGGNRLRGVPVDDDGNFLVDRSYNANEKDDFQDLEALVLQATLDHQFSEDLSLSTTLRRLDNEREQQYHESRSWVEVNGDGEATIDDGTIKREYRKQYRENTETSLTADFVYSLDNQEILFGGDYHRVDTDYDYHRARYEADGVGNLNIFELNYGETDPSSYNLTDMGSDGAKSNRYSVYLQDQITLGQRWSALVGLRYDTFEDTEKSSGYRFEDTALVPRAGLVFKPTDHTSVYLNYSESFQPIGLGSQEDVDGEGNLDPETGEQIELGVKNEWLDGSMMTTFAVYTIAKKDVAQANPEDGGPGDGIPALVNVGEVESQGFEATLVGDLSDTWTITANYAYNDTRVTQAVEGAYFRNTFNSGDRFTNAPEHQAGLWTRYDFPSIDSSIAFGADYVSEQFSLSGQRVKPFTVFDLSWSTAWNDTLVQVNAKNLFDKEYAVSGFNERNGHFPGEPRELVVQVTQDF
ncbi:TonB-dependent siderophore receptor [Microbulbifer halophilus]|uniref:TonB-dependent siderophore receptor n=1 Tax=Microbulbifer halophilus TaxID=453963 RepID=A0ABW5EB53_9GAMM|nr:TonB-dependent receptor [Microbulbifer halophilus]MCW8127257.1 TonB-dependent receptor [Microbulbifer halophilus]